MHKLIFIFTYFFCVTNSASSNNLQIGLVTTSNSGNNQYLNFSISWDNSWRIVSNPGNWDAVWVFVKRRDCASIQWHHAMLSNSDADHTSGSPLFVDAYHDKMGVMIYRSTIGSGNISNVNIQVKLDSPPEGTFEYKVFGIEMVYVNQGSFFVGDGTPSLGFRTGSTLLPYKVIDEDAIPISQNGSDLWGYFYTAGYTVPAIYPKGYNSFYCMKYEVSQGQYADFLNTIPSDAVLSRFDPAKQNQNRYTIAGSWPTFLPGSPDRACNWLSFGDLAAILDWSALSPMTELEFEKASRGNEINLPIANECAWGTGLIENANSIVSGTDGTAGEVVSETGNNGVGVANFGNDIVLGPLRCGFAAKNATGRTSAGASYYGIMELSGNVYEMAYSLYNTNFSQGINFNGTHGDGELSVSPLPGFANQNWPVENSPPQSAEVFVSICARGGSWLSPLLSTELAISDRTYYNISGIPNADQNGRAPSMGGRGISRRQ